MKYNFCLMNPPYGDNTPLYAKFFEKALEVADEVHSIMPVDLNTGATRTKAHNERVQRHMLCDPENVSHYFPTVGLRDKIHYVKASASQLNEVPEYKDPLDDMEILYPERDRLNVLIGRGVSSYIGHEDEKGPEVLWSIQRIGIIRKNITQEKYDTGRPHNSPWRVLVNNMPSKGVFNCEVVKGNQLHSIKIFAFGAKTKTEAMTIKEWLTSDTIVDEINKMLTAKNVYTVSRRMLERLPNYE